MKITIRYSRCGGFVEIKTDETECTMFNSDEINDMIYNLIDIAYELSKTQEKQLNDYISELLG